MAVGAAGITGGATLITGLISAKQRKKEREAEAKAKLAEEVRKGGEAKASALGGIISSLRASLM